MRPLLIATLLITSSYAQELEWLDDFEESRKASQLAELPIFLVIVRSDNADCKKQLAVFHEEKTREFLNNFILCQLNAETPATVKFMNRNGLRGATIPFMVLFARDNQTKMMMQGGYQGAQDFLDIFRPSLEQIEQGAVLTPTQMMGEYLKRSQKAIQEKRFKLALLNVDKAVAQADKLKLNRNVIQYAKKQEIIDQHGQIQVLEAKKQMKAGKTDYAIGIAKRVILDFGNRIPARKAQEFLDQHREKFGSQIDAVKALPEGYQKFIDAPEEKAPLASQESQESSKPKPESKKQTPKSLIKLTLKDGTTVVGSVVARSGSKIMFKIHNDDPKKQKSQFIRTADIAKEEGVE